MLRKLLILGVCAGTSASVPILYQANPQLFHGLLRSAMQGDGAPAMPENSVSALSQRRSGQAEQLAGRKVRLAADARGHFVADFKLNGRRVEALVDTGATVVAINASTARRIGLSLKAADFRDSVNTANGVAPAASVTLDRLEIGRIAVENVPAVVLDDKALSGTLIGMSFLNRLGKFQIENGALLLAQ
ncbi:MAG: TIGR02281 family clan AA aspartic protease [Pseudaminobacter sp.]|nr:TIGR02281 family clan AA aspartic protease [Pseudaminobacter sp.]